MKLLDDTSDEAYAFMKSAKRSDWFKKFMDKKRKDADGKAEALKKAASFMRKLADRTEDFYDDNTQASPQNFIKARGPKPAAAHVPEPAAKKFPPEAYIKPKEPGYSPSKSHYAADGTWVGDATAAEASKFWKQRAALKKAAALMRKLAEGDTEDLTDAPTVASPTTSSPNVRAYMSSKRHQPHGRGGYKATWDYCKKNPGDPICKRFSKAANVLVLAALWKAGGAVGAVKPCECTRSGK